LLLRVFFTRVAAVRGFFRAPHHEENDVRTICHAAKDSKSVTKVLNCAFALRRFAECARSVLTVSFSMTTTIAVKRAIASSEVNVSAEAPCARTKAKDHASRIQGVSA
jgi:hypothetical protein